MKIERNTLIGEKIRKVYVGIVTVRLRLQRGKKMKCKNFGHDSNVNAPKDVGGCAIIYRKGEELKSCPCEEFVEDSK